VFVNCKTVTNNELHCHAAVRFRCMFVETQEASTVQHSTVQYSTGYCHRAVAACSQPLPAEETTKLPCMAGKVQIGGGGN